jgi:hypothetical protein
VLAVVDWVARHPGYYPAWAWLSARDYWPAAAGRWVCDCVPTDGSDAAALPHRVFDWLPRAGFAHRYRPCPSYSTFGGGCEYGSWSPNDESEATAVIAAVVAAYEVQKRQGVGG